MRISEKERLTELYYCLKAVPEELWRGKNYDVVQGALSDKKINREQSISFHIIGRVAHVVRNETEFVNSIRTNELPSIKLTPEEMEVLSGGARELAKTISKGEIGNSSDSLNILRAHYDAT